MQVVASAKACIDQGGQRVVPRAWSMPPKSIFDLSPVADLGHRRLASDYQPIPRGIMIFDNERGERP